MRRVALGVSLFALACMCGASCCIAGANSRANLGLVAIAAGGDTLCYEVSVNSAVKTRVIHLLFDVPDNIRFLSWEDGGFISDALRIGPHVYESSGDVLVSLAQRGPASITESLGTVGTARFLRTGPVVEQVSLLEGYLVDSNLRMDWMASPASRIYPARRANRALGVPDRFGIEHVSPNPVVRGTTIRFQIPRPGSSVALRIYDVTGRSVRTLVDGHRGAGYHSELWDRTNDNGIRVAPGIYFCRMEAGKFQETRKLVLLQ